MIFCHCTQSQHYITEFYVFYMTYFSFHIFKFKKIQKSCADNTDSNSSTNPILLPSDNHSNAHSMSLFSNTLLEFPHGNTIESDLLFKEQID